MIALTDLGVYMQGYVLLSCTLLVLQVMSSMRASESRCRRNCFEGPVWTSTDGPAAMKELGTVSALVRVDADCRTFFDLVVIACIFVSKVMCMNRVGWICIHERAQNSRSISSREQ